MTPLNPRVRALYRCSDCGAFRVLVSVLHQMAEGESEDHPLDAHSGPRQANCHWADYDWHPPHTKHGKQPRPMDFVSAIIIVQPIP